MPAASRLGDLSAGHGCFPPTNAVATPATSVYINGILALTVDGEFSAHTCGDTTHPQSNRKVVSGSPTVFVEGKPLARIGDPIGCGDAVAEGSPNVFSG
ncbi:hypothetical protein [Synechococcus phage BUCT-ZZ01]|nr:hypothetical protein [Synechococcus phage BUCT-ZZ01]